MVIKVVGAVFMELSEIITWLVGGAVILGETLNGIHIRRERPQ